MNRITVARILEVMGYTVFQAASGELAVAAFETGMFDLALMDVSIPGMDGVEATRRIRVLPRGRGLTAPVLAFTAHATLDDRERLLPLGFDGSVAKPAETAYLRRADESPLAARRHGVAGHS